MSKSTQKRKISAESEQRKDDITQTVTESVNDKKTRSRSSSKTTKDSVVEETPIENIIVDPAPAPTVETVQKPTIDIESLKAELYEQIKKQVIFEINRAETAKEKAAEVQATLSKSELNLVGEKHYTVSSDLDGLVISENSIPLFTINKSGVVGVGLKAPRGYGRGSMHIRSNYTSEASIPTNGLNSTRGLIVEGDGDDEKTFTLRVLSRMNKQGLNVTGDGSLILGLMNDDSESKLTVYQPVNDEHALHIHTPSKFYNANMIDLETRAYNNKTYNFIDARREATVNNDYSDTISAFRVDGTGSVYADTSFISNRTGYAEYFEWEDNNHRKEDRTGFAVTITKMGKIRVANEGDIVLGVVVKHSAFIGNAAWNSWNKRTYLDPLGNRRQRKYQVMEWNTQDNLTESYYNGELPKNFAYPENCVTYETDLNGNDLYRDFINNAYDKDRGYISRENRGFPLIQLIGRAIIYKGQVVSPMWIKIRDINDELEEWIIK